MQAILLWRHGTYDPNLVSRILSLSSLAAGFVEMYVNKLRSGGKSST